MIRKIQDNYCPVIENIKVSGIVAAFDVFMKKACFSRIITSSVDFRMSSQGEDRKAAGRCLFVNFRYVAPDFAN
jgi:hypothetical protein